MTSAPAATLGRLEERRPLITPVGWCWIIGLALLFVFVHATYLERLFRIVTGARGDGIFELLISAAGSTWNPDWSHALIVPLISLYYIFQHRHELAASRPRVYLPALPLVFLGLFSYAFWVFPGRNDMFQGYSMLLTLFASVLFLLGPSPMRVLWFPIAYLVFAVKIADSVWERIAWELQQIASLGAEFALNFFTAFLDFSVGRRGTTLDLIFVQGGIPVQESLNVAEACSGLRSLMAFVALGTALAFLWERPWWQRLVMVAMAVPIAVGVNIARVTVIGLLYLVDPAYAQGDFHTMVGMLMLIPAAGLFLLLGWIMDRIIVRDEVEADDADAAPRAGDETVASASLAVEAPAEARPAQAKAAASVIGAAALAGIVAMLAAGLTYWLSFMTGSPIESGSLLVTMAAQMTWLVLPAAIIGFLLCGVAWRFMQPLISRLGQYLPASRATRLTATGLLAGVLVTMAVGQSAVVAALDVVLIKQPVPLRHPLVLIPADAGSWTLWREDPPLPKEQVEELGTDQYISRIYEDTSWPENKPGRLARLHVAYYTGTTDTVPHVPDRCFVAGGVQGLDVGATSLTLRGDHYQPDTEHGGLLAPAEVGRADQRRQPVRIPAETFPATYFTFGDPSGDRVENVIYFFAVNGKYLPTPNHVRAEGFDARDKYSYYCKVEVQLLGVADRELAAERASALLSDLLPGIMACLPDWVDVTEGRWPETDAGRSD